MIPRTAAFSARLLPIRGGHPLTARSRDRVDHATVDPQRRTRPTRASIAVTTGKMPNQFSAASFPALRPGRLLRRSLASCRRHFAAEAGG
jgi:hypothetical protein